MTEQPNSPCNSDELTNGGYRLRLYVTGVTPNSARAIANLTAFCEKYLKDNYELEIIDVYQQPLVAEAEQLIAIPMLIKLAPLPRRKLIGDMSDSEKILKGLDLAAR